MKELLESRQVLNLNKIPAGMLIEVTVNDKSRTFTIEALLGKLGQKNPEKAKKTTKAEK